MNGYAGYPEYRDSGENWLGALPVTWNLIDGKRAFRNRREAPADDDVQLSASQKYGVFPQAEMMALEQSKVMLALKGTAGFRHTEVDDFVISLRAFEGGVEHSQHSGCVSPAYTVLEARSIVHHAYFRYLFKSAPYIAALQATTDSLRDGKSITYDQFGSIGLPIPSRSEQRQVANFLDYETVKIDTLIENQQQLIKLLKEKRQAMISHAVTKGLNPDAPMKDSGVEWLGEVPAGWVVRKIKYCAAIESGHTPNKKIEKYWENCYIPWVSLNDSKWLKENHYIENTKYLISDLGLENSSARLLPERCVLFTRDASIGLSAIATKPMAVSQHIIAWIAKANLVVPEYLLLIFYAMEKEFQRSTFGATIKTIGMDDVRALVAAFPEVSEQGKIVAHTFKEMSRLTDSVELVGRTMELLRERRATLISAAVTGKIDVRNWQPPKPAPSPSADA